MDNSDQSSENCQTQVNSPRSPVLLSDFVDTAVHNSVRKTHSSPTPSATLVVNTSSIAPNSAIVANNLSSTKESPVIVTDTVVSASATVTDTPVVVEPVVVTNVAPNSEDPVVTSKPNLGFGENNPRKWNDVVKGPSQLGMSLFFDEHSKNSTEIEVNLEDFQGELDYWKYTLMGNFLGSKPNLKQVQDFAQKAWKQIASPVVQYYRKGWFSFRFTTQEDMNNVLREGPWKLGSRSLILKQWYPNFSMEMDKVSTVPIWVLFPDLEPFLWSESVLSKMASKIGKPLFADLNTTCKTKLSFARILVEADVSATLPDEIVLNTPFHGQTVQRIIYEWLPFHCSGCGKLGHKLSSCKWHQPTSSDPKKVYKAKPSTNPIPPSVPQPEVELGSVCHELGGTSDGQIEAATPEHVQDQSVHLAGSSHVLGDGSSSLTTEMHSECHVLGSHSPQHAGSPRVVDRRSQIAKKRDCTEAEHSDNHSDAPLTENRFDSLSVNNISSWNIRGCNDPLKQQEIRDFLWSNKLDILGVLETRVKKKNADNIIKNKFSNYSVICNYDCHYNGRIWLIFNPVTVTVKPILSHAQFIHCAINHHATSQNFFLTMVYGSNDPKIREDLWTALSSIQHSVTSLVLLGDFNVIRDVSEKISPTPPNLDDILAFNTCLFNCRLDDMRGSGCEYTWTNKQDDSSRTWSKLDRALANPDWFNQFPTTYANFFFLWDLVTQAWHLPVQGTAMFKLFGKLKNVRVSLFGLHKQNYSDISNRVVVAKAALLDCQAILQSCPLSPDLIHKEKQLLIDYNTLKQAEMSFLKQKAKVDNIKHGDCSSKYFFSRLQERKTQQIIGKIVDRHGTDRIGLSDVAEGFVDYYSHLLDSTTPTSHLDTSLIHQGSCVSPEDSASLIKPVSLDEIKAALFSIGSDKSPRPDGFSSGFFKDSWELISSDFCKAVLNFFKTGKMSKQANSTLLTLIPKKKISNS
ncbi:uncharacterized protein LOC141642767 [Silene latifolia]|uniref:uncharacterized protein LOC141642767 n=1 Tax=Silene latifolia TaxID=37657 RepID=UPI003D76E9B3